MSFFCSWDSEGNAKKDAGFPAASLCINSAGIGNLLMARVKELATSQVDAIDSSHLTNLSTSQIAALTSVQILQSSAATTLALSINIDALTTGDAASWPRPSSGR